MPSTSSVPASDPFAPPEDEDAARLEVDYDAVRQGPSSRSSRAQGAPKAAPAAALGASRSRGKGVFFFVLLLLLVAGGAGYRYHMLGYWGLEPPAAPRFEVRIRVIPDRAQILVDGEPAAALDLTAEAGARFELVASAAGRLSVRRTLTIQEDSRSVFELRLPLALSPLDPADSRLLAEAIGGDAREGLATFSEVDSAAEKLSLYERCLARASDLRAGGHRELLEAAPLRPGSAGATAALRPFPADALTECRALVGAARDRSPVLDEVDAAAVAYVAALDRVARAGAELFEHLETDNPRRQPLRRAAKLTRELREAHDLAAPRERKLLSVLHRELHFWQRLELEAIGRTGGEDLHFHLRRAALASQARALAEEGQAPHEERARWRRALEEAVQSASEYAEARPEEMEGTPGSAAFVRAVSVALSADPSEAVSRHNLVVERFNEMTLP